MRENLDTPAISQDQQTLEKIKKGQTISRRQFLKFVAGASAVVLGTALGIKVSENDEEVPQNTSLKGSVPENQNESALRPEITKNVRSIINELNLRTLNPNVINSKFDRVTSVISRLEVVTPEEYKLNQDPSLYIVAPQVRLGMKKEDYKDTLKNPDYLEDKTGVKYISQLINNLLNAELIQEEINDIPQLVQFLRNNPSIFTSIRNFREFSINFKSTLSDYATIVISGGKVSFIYGLKDVEYKGVLPVSTTTGQDSCVNTLQREDLMKLNQPGSVYFRMRL
jgi:hypothetical protein